MQIFPEAVIFSKRNKFFLNNLKHRLKRKLMLIETPRNPKLAHHSSFRLIVAINIVLISYIQNAKASTQSKIDSIYFNSDSSFVIQTASKTNLEIKQDTNLIAITNTKLNHKIDKKLYGTNFDLELGQNKNETIVKINPKNNSNYTLQTRNILDGLAYEFNLEASKPIQETTEIKPIETTHQLSIEAAGTRVYEFNLGKSEVDKFLDTLNDDVAAQVEMDPKFKNQSFKSIDSTALVSLAETLSNKGFHEEALAAYRRSIELDPQNLNAKLGLAKITSDQKEKLDNYLASIDNEALLGVGDAWFSEAYQNGDLKTMAKALISLQLAVLKNPRNSEYRFHYAQALEKFGQNSKETSKRYLEAAALAKQEYLAGNKASESLLRNATEALIRVLVLDGDFEAAAKYCVSYLNLGFVKFLNGKPTLAIMKEVEASRNPFASTIINRRAS